MDYCDQRGRRHIKTFARRHNADAFHSKVAVDVSAGIHTPDRESITVAAAGELWMRDRGAAGLERTTLMNYRVYLDRHITPAIGAARLSQLTVPAARAFEDRLRAQHSPTMVRAILGALGAIIDDAQERGLVAQNVVRCARGRCAGAARIARIERRHKGKLKIGVDIPAPDEMRAIIAGSHAQGSASLAAAAADRDLHRPARHASCAACAGPTSTSSAASCTCASAPTATARSGGRSRRPASARCRCRRWSSHALREWKLACPKGELDLVFPNSRGGVEHRISHRRARASIRPRSRPAWSPADGKREIHRPAQRCAISMPRGASTGASTAGSSCRSRWCRRGSATPRSR